jgi:hypothetical protein
MFARPVAIAAMPFADRFASRAVRGSTSTRITPGSALRFERLAGYFDRAQAMLASSLGRARIAVPAPALEHRLAAHRARGWKDRAAVAL